MRLKDRASAARLLTEKLIQHKGENPLILAIPRAAVPMGRAIADALDGELDIVLVREISAPDNPELAIGSVDESGEVLVSDSVGEHEIPPGYVRREARHQLELIRGQRALFTPVRSAADPRGRLVIVLDNRVATGATLIAALRLVRKHRPRRLVAAMAVAPPRTVERVRQIADEVVCLGTPWELYAVGTSFEDFSEITDSEVIAALARPARVAEEATV